MPASTSTAPRHGGAASSAAPAASIRSGSWTLRQPLRRRVKAIVPGASAAQ
jgi:hypothetical protein